MATFRAEKLRCTISGTVISRTQHHQFAKAVLIQICGEKFCVIDAEKLLQLTGAQSVCRYSPNYLVAELAANHDLESTLMIHGNVLHLIEGSTVQLNGIQQGELLPRAGEDKDPQRLFTGAPCKDKVFPHPISVQIRALHILLMLAGGRRAIFHRGHSTVDNGLQIGILLGFFWQAVQLVNGLGAAAGKNGDRKQRQKQ